MFNRIRHSEILLNGIKLISASSLSQLVAVLAYPFITRLYDPSSLGQLSLFLALVGLGCILASAQYENAIMIETDSRNAATIVDICFLLAIITSFLIFVISYSFSCFWEMTIVFCFSSLRSHYYHQQDGSIRFGAIAITILATLLHIQPYKVLFLLA